MTNAAAEEWRERLDWAFGLVDPDPAVRAAAIDHLLLAQAATERALELANQAWWETRGLSDVERDAIRPDYAAVWRAYHETGRHSLPDGVWDCPYGEAVTAWPGLPYALLFLEWELAYPDAWTTHAKAWGTKEGLIRDLAVPGHAPPVRAKLIGFVEAAVRRAYRCKDREYVRIARAVDGPDLRARLEAAADDDSPWARLHAGYVLHLLDRPDLPNSRRVWQAWCKGDPT